MICNVCGKENENTNTFCGGCGNPLVQQTTSIPYAQPNYNPYNQPNNLVANKCAGMGQIITCLVLALSFSALPAYILSTIALFFRGKYESALKYNDITSANDHASKIKIMMIISWVLVSISIFSMILLIVFMSTFYIGIFSAAFSEYPAIESFAMAFMR